MSRDLALVRTRADAANSFFRRKMTDGLFLECAQEVASRYTDIAFEEELLDLTCLKVCGSRCVFM